MLTLEVYLSSVEDLTGGQTTALVALDTGGERLITRVFILYHTY